MNRAEARREAFREMVAVRLPDGWGQYTAHLNYSGHRHHAGKGLVMPFAALGTSPGWVEVSCCGMTILTSAENLPKAINHILDWVETVKPGG